MASISNTLLEISQNHPVILFDGYCMLCNGFIQKVLKRDKRHFFRFSTLSSDRSDLPDSVILIYRSKVYDRSTAALLIFKHLGLPYSILSILIFIPRFIRDGVYNWIAKNRYRWFGQTDSCYLPDPTVKKRFVEG